MTTPMTVHPVASTTADQLRAENAELRRRFEEAEETIRAIQTGAVDAFVVDSPTGSQIYTLEGADRPYRLLVEQMQQGAATLHQDGTIAYGNQRLADLLQVPHEKLIGARLRDFIASDDVGAYEKLLRQSQTRAGRGEAHLRRTSGELVPAYLTLNALPPDCGAAIGMLVTDLTTQKHHERLAEAYAALRLSQRTEAERRAEFEAIMNVAPAAIWVAHDPHCQHVTGNRAARRLLRVDPDDDVFESASFDGLGRQAAVFRDGQPLQVDELPIRMAARSNQVAANQELELRFPDGSSSWVYGSAVPLLNGDGKVRGAIAAFVDVTERKRAEQTLQRSEERFRQMANSTPAIIWTADPTGAITFRNQRWLDYTGIDSAANVRDWPRLVLHPLDYQRCVDAWQQALARGYEYEIEVRNRRYDGEYRWFLTRATPIRDATGRIVEWYGSTTDIHDRKLAEESLRDADRRKDEFLATLAHELRNPLAPIRNSLHVLRLAGSDGMATERVHDMMERQVNHLVRLVDDLMEVSRITRGKFELRKEPIELAAVVRSAVETSKPLIEAGRHQLAISLPTEPLILNADPVRLAQIVANLLNNAAKYTEEGGQILLAVRQEGPNAVISVKDNGIGIPAGMLPKVFDLFTQANRTYNRAQGGLGIGLTLVRSLVDMHGGSVVARSEGSGRGSEFEVRIPLIAASLNSNLSEHPPRTFPVAPHRVLIVDDNRDAADSLGMLLTLLGAQVCIVNDGQAALEALAIHRPSVVLLDLGMPDMDGYEVARQARQHPYGRDVTLVAMTGWGQEEDRRRSREAGIDHHLVKPVDLGALHALLASLPNNQSPPIEAP